MKIYFAGALFSTAEKNFNQQLSQILKTKNNNLEIILPQEQAKEIAGDKDFEQKVFNYCISGVREADIILAVLDGPDVDSGTCIELGYGYALKEMGNKLIIGVRTDLRGSEFEGLNIMVHKVLDHYIYVPFDNNSTEEIADKIIEILAQFPAEHNM